MRGIETGFIFKNKTNLTTMFFLNKFFSNPIIAVENISFHILHFKNIISSFIKKQKMD